MENEATRPGVGGRGGWDLPLRRQPLGTLSFRQDQGLDERWAFPPALALGLKSPPFPVVYKTTAASPRAK